MTKRETFIKEIEELFLNTDFNLSEDALTFFESLRLTEDKEKPAFTDNGKMILKDMQQNSSLCNNMFKAKDIADRIGVSSRTVSGGIRKLVTDGYVEKLGENPVIYSITDKGIEVNFEEE